MSRLSRLLLSGLLLVAVYFAVFGGEYSAFELRARRADLERETVRLSDLEAQIDSLSAWADSLQHDDATLERVARERFGMIKRGETLYRFTEPDEGADEERGRS